MRVDSTYRTRIVYAGLLLGIACGLILAEGAARFLRLRDGKRDLDSYAIHLSQVANQVNAEGQQAVETVLRDKLPSCSPEELRLMRGLVYNSVEIKDIGPGA